MPAPKGYTPMVRARMLVDAIHESNTEGTPIPITPMIAAEMEFAKFIALVTIAESLQKIAESLGDENVDYWLTKMKRMS